MGSTVPSQGSLTLPNTDQPGQRKPLEAGDPSLGAQNRKGPRARGPDCWRDPPPHRPPQALPDQPLHLLGEGVGQCPARAGRVWRLGARGAFCGSRPLCLSKQGNPPHATQGREGGAESPGGFLKAPLQVAEPWGGQRRGRVWRSVPVRSPHRQAAQVQLPRAFHTRPSRVWDSPVLGGAPPLIPGSRPHLETSQRAQGAGGAAAAAAAAREPPGRSGTPGP